MPTQSLEVDLSAQFSQHGEDAIVAGLLERLSSDGVPLDRSLVDVGCSDGVTYSNSARLIYSYGYSGVLVDSDGYAARLAEANHAGSAGVRVVSRKVGWEPGCTVSDVACPLGASTGCDVLSIDVDGDDFHVWESSGMRAKVVVVEFNHTIPPGCIFVQPKGSPKRLGSSLDALCILGRSLRYRLAAVTRCNAVLVREDLCSKWGMESRPSVLRSDLSQCCWVFHGYDGDVACVGNAASPWIDGFDLTKVLGMRGEP